MITIRGSNQEVFDRAVKRLAQQDWQRCIADGVCAYRRDNMVCAIGALIADEAYSPEIEDLGVEKLLTTGRVALDGCAKALLKALQLAHDDAGTPREMRKRLRDVAHQFDLTMPTELQEAAQ